MAIVIRVVLFLLTLGAYGIGFLACAACAIIGTFWISIFGVKTSPIAALQVSLLALGIVGGLIGGALSRVDIQLATPRYFRR